MGVLPSGVTRSEKGVVPRRKALNPGQTGGNLAQPARSEPLHLLDDSIRKFALVDEILVPLVAFLLFPASYEAEEIAVLKSVGLFEEVRRGHEPDIIPEIAALSVKEAENDGHREVVDHVVRLHGCGERLPRVVPESAFYLKVHDLRHALLLHNDVNAFVVRDRHVACERCFPIERYEFRDTRFRDVAFLFFGNALGDLETSLLFFLFGCDDRCGRYLDYGIKRERGWCSFS